MVMSRPKQRVVALWLRCKRGIPSLSTSKDAVSMLNFLRLRLPLAWLIGRSQFRTTRVAFLLSIVPWLHRRQRGPSPNRTLRQGKHKAMCITWRPRWTAVTTRRRQIDVNQDTAYGILVLWQA